MNLDTLADPTKKALTKLDFSPFFKESGGYLAGGSGLAIHLGHRYSYDLDFFTKKKFDEDSTIQLLDEAGRFKLERRHWQTILGKFEGVKFSLFFLKYPLIAPSTIILRSINLASLEDIAAMKIAAIADRSTKRDFIDLFFLAKHFPLGKILHFYDQKYKNLAAQRTHILRSLIYFTDARLDPMPEMIKTVDWDEVKEFLTGEVKKIAKRSDLI